jgi:anti-anti-sigma factor
MTQQLILSGEQTIYQAADLHRMLVEALSKKEALEVELSGVSEFDSAAAQIMIWLQRECERLGLALALIEPSQSVLDLVALLGLARVLTFQETHS